MNKFGQHGNGAALEHVDCKANCSVLSPGFLPSEPEQGLPDGRYRPAQISTHEACLGCIDCSDVWSLLSPLRWLPIVEQVLSVLTQWVHLGIGSITLSAISILNLCSREYEQYRVLD